ncbi:Arginase, catabolizes arginine to ornithine and urea [Ascosphaera pollenicola]|nr:Arginase, catabolizes arginine to ornithine and urea [Ascosphaera pollenicola]
MTMTINGKVVSNGTHTMKVKTGYQGRYTTSHNELGLSIASFAGGQRKPGVATGPEELLNNGLEEILDERGFQATRRDLSASVAQVQDDPDVRGMKSPRSVSAFCRALSEQTYQLAKNGRLVLTLGGDHSIAMGSISGMSRAIRERFPAGVAHSEVSATRIDGNGTTCPAKPQDIGVIWVDAHPDINTPESSDSGNVHGMPVAFLSGLVRGESEDVFGWMKPEHNINLQKLVYIGIRDADVGEKRIIREHGILTFTMHDVEELGIRAVVDMALKHIGSETPIHLSFDVDAIDPVWVPGTGTPVPAGLTLREGQYICRNVHDTGRLVSMDVVEVNPAIDGISQKEKSQTLQSANSLIRAALGHKLL